jgi:putative copper resistance protein D
MDLIALDPGVIVWLAVLEGLYLRALRTLRRRGVAVPLGQKLCWHAAMALWTVGLMGPPGALAGQLLSAHMGEHLLIADLAAPLMLAGLRNPVLGFFLPRPLLVQIARSPRLRRAFRTLRRPLVAIAVYALVLYGWHVSLLFESAVRHDGVHVLQHLSFIGAGVLVWWSVLEPKRRRLPGELWKIGHIISARFLGMFLGMSFVLIRVPIYTGVYGSGDRRGLTPLTDQQIAGAMMVVLDILIMVFALAFLFWRAGQEEDRRRASQQARAVST